MVGRGGLESAPSAREVSSIAVSEKIHFKMMSLMHETLYGMFRDPYKALKAAGVRPGRRVLEVGCGPGFFTVPAAEMVGDTGEVYALDMNPFAIERVREKIARAGVDNVHTLQADAAETGLPSDTFDLVFLFGLNHAKGGMERILKEVNRVLKADGSIATEGRLWDTSELFCLKKSDGRIFQFSPVNGVVKSHEVCESPLSSI